MDQDENEPKQDADVNYTNIALEIKGVLDNSTDMTEVLAAVQSCRKASFLMILYSLFPDFGKYSYLIG